MPSESRSRDERSLRPPFADLAAAWSGSGFSRAAMFHPEDEDYVRACTMAGARLNLRQVPWRASGQQAGSGLTILVYSAKALRPGALAGARAVQSVDPSLIHGSQVFANIQEL